MMAKTRPKLRPESSPFLKRFIVALNPEGIPAAIPAKIIKEIPFPTPLEVICSPNHIRNIVPPTRVITVVILKKRPGSKTGEYAFQ